MKILYITSGYTRIYRYLDRSIVRAFNSIDVTVKAVLPSINLIDLKNMINSFKPTLIFTLLGTKMSNDTLKYLRFQSIPFAIWLTEDPYYFDNTKRLIEYVDYVFTIDIGAKEAYLALGKKNVFHLPLGTDPQLYKPMKRYNDEGYELCFIGHPYPNRVELIKFILQETSYTIKLIGSGWNKQLENYALGNCDVMDRWVPPTKVATYYTNAKIVINTHRPYDEPSNKNESKIVNRSINNRTFDIAACNGFQLIQEIDDLSSHFKVNEEMIGFSDWKDLLVKIDYYLNTPSDRISIATKAREKTLKMHTFKARTERIVTIIKQTPINQ